MYPLMSRELRLDLYMHARYRANRTRHNAFIKGTVSTPNTIDNRGTSLSSRITKYDIQAFVPTDKAAHI